MAKNDGRIVVSTANGGVVIDTNSRDVVGILSKEELTSIPESERVSLDSVDLPPELRELAVTTSDLTISIPDNRTYRIPTALRTMFELAMQNRDESTPLPDSITNLVNGKSLSVAELRSLSNDSSAFWQPYVGEAFNSWMTAVVASANIPLTPPPVQPTTTSPGAFDPTNPSTYYPVQMPAPNMGPQEKLAAARSQNKTTLQRWRTLDPDPYAPIKEGIERVEKLSATGNKTRSEQFSRHLRSFFTELMEVSGENVEAGMQRLKNKDPGVAKFLKENNPEYEAELERDKKNPVEDTPSIGEDPSYLSSVIGTGQGPTSTDTVPRKTVKARLPHPLVTVADPNKIIPSASPVSGPEANPTDKTITASSQDGGTKNNEVDEQSESKPDRGSTISTGNRPTTGQPDPTVADVDIEPSGEALPTHPNPNDQGAGGTSSESTLITPDNTSAKPRYLAIVDQADTQSVLDLIAVVPQSDRPGDVKVFVRQNKTWEESDEYLTKLRGTNPPPVVSLEDPELIKEVTSQVDAWEKPSDNEALQASAAQPETNARNVVKPAVRAQQMASDTMAPAEPAAPAAPKEAATPTPSQTAESTVPVANPESASSSTDSGLPQATRYKFKIPLVLPIGVPSGDGRQFSANSLSHRELPIPLMWQQQGFDGHSGSVIVGRVDALELTDKGLENAVGTFDTGPFAQEAIRLIKNEMLRGISADLDNFKASVSNTSNEKDSKTENSVGSPKMDIESARLMGITLVAKPAFQECHIIIEEEPVKDGVYVEKLPQSLTASATPPVDPPKGWFENPSLTEPTPLTIGDDGRVFGHIALWNTDHIGMPNNTKPPKSTSDYAYFHTGVVKTAEGDTLPVGQLTLAGGHAPLDATAASAVRHYDDTASAVADIKVGEDEHGIWATGALRPDVSALQMRTLRASSPSGDWRPIRGSLELVAVCQVNVPGFPVTRARVASGAITALVAAGASVLAQMRYDHENHVERRLHQLEDGLSSVLLASRNFQIDTTTQEGLVAAAALQRARVYFRR